jgi:hypothetical protein
MRLIYIASPYTVGDVAGNVHIQIEAAHKILDLGHCPIVPLLSHYLHIHRQRDYEDWVKMDLAIIPRVDALIRLPGESRGADSEVELAKSTGVKVVFGWPELESWLSYE